MLRLFLVSMLTCASAWAQAAPQAPSNVPNPPMAAQQPAFHPENVGPDTVVIEIQGVCSGLGDGATKTAPCTTQITKSQFTAMVTAVTAGNPMSSTAAQRSFAESYVQLLALASAGEKAGIEKDPEFMALMKIVRIRTMGEAYRHFLEGKASNPSPEEIEAYYKQNSAKYEQVKVDRVIIPTVSARHVSGSPADAAKKVKDLANEVRERAIKGEDMTILQAYAYKTLNLPAPPNADMGSHRRGTLPSNVEPEIFALKPGEVTKVETEPAGFTIYRLRTRDVPSVDAVRGEILRDLHQKKVENTIKAVMDNVHTNLNLDYFTPYTSKGAASHSASPARSVQEPKNNTPAPAPAGTPPASVPPKQ